MEDEQKIKVASKIVEEIVSDLRGRQGIGDEFDHIDEEVKASLVDDWIRIAVYFSYEKTPAPGEYPFVFFDEAHRMGRLESQKSHLPDQIKGRKTLLGTGTVVRNEPAELIPLLRAIGVDVPRDRVGFNKRFVEDVQVSPGFIDRYLRGVKPGNKQQAKNIAEFRKMIRGKVDYYRGGTKGYPSVEEKDSRVPMSKPQEDTYRRIMSKMGPMAYKVQKGIPPSKQESRNLNAFLGGARQVSNTAAAFNEAASGIKDAPKIRRAVQEIVSRHKRDQNYRGVTYSNYLSSGLEPIAQGLEEKGISHGFFTGAQTPKQRSQLLDDFQKGKVRHLLISSAGSEGLDLKGTKLMQILEPHWNDARLDQAEARAVRYKSHDHLPESERKVEIQRFVSEPSPKRTWLPWKKESVQGVDEYLRTLSRQKTELNQAFVDAIAQEGG